MRRALKRRPFGAEWRRNPSSLRVTQALELLDGSFFDDPLPIYSLSKIAASVYPIPTPSLVDFKSHLHPRTRHRQFLRRSFHYKNQVDVLDGSGRTMAAKVPSVENLE
jgi:hypothetical protein